MFYLVGYDIYENEVSTKLNGVFGNKQEEEEKDLMFRINFKQNTIKIQTTDLSQYIQTFLGEY